MKVPTLVLVAFLAVLTAGCKNTTEPVVEKSTAPEPTSGVNDKGTSPVDAKPKLTALGIKDTKVGKGAPAKTGDTVYVAYIGKLGDGKVFDNSEDHNSEFPFAVKLGGGQVIQGWDQGLIGMKVGGERDLAIPSALGYGDSAAAGGVIPPNSDLFFHIKLLDFIPQKDEDVVDVKDIKKGSGRTAKKGDTVTIHYVGTSITGKKFDSSRDRGAPFEFQLGAGQVVPGFDSGIMGMKVGGLRHLRIPPKVGYGNNTKGKIPPDAVLIFDIELLGVK